MRRATETQRHREAFLIPVLGLLRCSGARVLVLRFPGALDRYTAPDENFVLVVPQRRRRIAVLGARSAPRETGNQPRALLRYQGQSLWLVSEANRNPSLDSTERRSSRHAGCPSTGVRAHPPTSAQVDKNLCFIAAFRSIDVC